MGILGKWDMFITRKYGVLNQPGFKAFINVLLDRVLCSILKRSWWTIPDFKELLQSVDHIQPESRIPIFLTCHYLMAAPTWVSNLEKKDQTNATQIMIALLLKNTYIILANCTNLVSGYLISGSKYEENYVKIFVYIHT